MNEIEVTVDSVAGMTRALHRVADDIEKETGRTAIANQIDGGYDEATQEVYMRFQIGETTLRIKMPVLFMYPTEKMAVQ
jgi:hypothetical protein